MTSKCGKNKKVAHEAQPSVSLMFLPYFDVLCDLLLNRRTATCNLFVLYNKELKYTGKSLFISNFSTLTDTKIAFDVIYCLYKMKRTDASESMVMADARTEWLVYIWESFASTDIVFVISPNLLTPRGLFSYQTAFSVFTLCFGYWKNAEHDGFNFDTKTFRLANASSSSPVL